MFLWQASKAIVFVILIDQMWVAYDLQLEVFFSFDHIKQPLLETLFFYIFLSKTIASPRWVKSSAC